MSLKYEPASEPLHISWSTHDTPTHTVSGSSSNSPFRDHHILASPRHTNSHRSAHSRHTNTHRCADARRSTHTRVPNTYKHTHRFADPCRGELCHHRHRSSLSISLSLSHSLSHTHTNTLTHTRLLSISCVHTHTHTNTTLTQTHTGSQIRVEENSGESPKDRLKKVKESFSAGQVLSLRNLLIDNLLVRFHFIVVVIRWTGLSP